METEAYWFLFAVIAFFVGWLAWSLLMAFIGAVGRAWRGEL